MKPFPVSRAARVIGIFAVFTWAHGLLNVWPLPPTSDLLPVGVQWSIWRESMGFTALGLLAGFLAFRSIRFWWLAILLTSGAVLSLTLDAMIGDAGHATSLRAWFTNLYGNLPAKLLYFVLVVPLYHVVLILAVLVYGVFVAWISASTTSAARR
jgi:hypothetical protein